MIPANAVIVMNQWEAKNLSGKVIIVGAWSMTRVLRQHYLSRAIERLSQPTEQFHYQEASVKESQRNSCTPGTGVTNNSNEQPTRLYIAREAEVQEGLSRHTYLVPPRNIRALRSTRSFFICAESYKAVMTNRREGILWSALVWTEI